MTCTVCNKIIKPDQENMCRYRNSVYDGDIIVCLECMKNPKRTLLQVLERMKTKSDKEDEECSATPSQSPDALPE